MEVALRCLDLFGVDRAKGSYVMTILVVRLLVVSGMVVSLVYCRRTEQDTARIPVGNQKTHLTIGTALESDVVHSS